MLADIVDIFQDIIIPEAENDPTILFQTDGSLFVIMRRIATRMLRPVNLYNHPVFGTCEVNDIACDWQLPAKAQAH